MNPTTTKTLIFLLTFLCTTAIFHSCVKEEIFLDKPSRQVNGNLENFNPSIPDKLITTSIFGLVVDENENPVSNSEVQLKTIHGFQSTTTDHNGNFLFSKVMVFQNSTLLKVHRTSKMPAFRKMSVTKDSYNYTKIKLLDKTIIGSLPSTQGGTLQDVSSPAKIDLAANSVRLENGGEYAGNVEVAMSWIDPTAEDLAERMVGDLSGIDKNGNPMALGTFGMLNVELIGENGEALQLKEGTTATLSFPVPDELLTQAPPTIPLWSFDEELGTWIEEGSANLQDGFYVGKVTHFSSWNVDTKTNPISISGEVFIRVDEENMGVPYLQVFVDIEGGRVVGGYLDDSGEFEFYNFPANTPFTLSILDACNEVLWAEELGPFAEDTDLGTIVIQGVENNFVKINGSGVDCNENPIEDGYAKIEVNKTTFIHPLMENSAFEFIINVCNETEGNLYVIDISNQKISLAETVEFSTTSISLPTLAACDEIQFFIDIDLNGEDWGYFIDVEAYYFLTTTDLVISGRDHNLDLTVALYWYEIPVTGVGTYENVFLNIGYSPNQENTTNILFTNVEITEFGENSGDIIRGTLYQEYTDPETGEISYPITGTFKAILR